MTERLDGFLSGKAQAVWGTALVYQTEAGAFELRRRGEPVLDLGDTFKDARLSLYAMIRAHHREKAATVGGSKE